MVQFKYGAFQTEFDPTEVPFLEMYETVTEGIQEKINEKASAAFNSTGKASDIFRAGCETIFKVFDDLFGEGTSQKMFEGKMSLECCARAFIMLDKDVNGYISNFGEIIGKMLKTDIDTDDGEEKGKGKRAKK